MERWNVQPPATIAQEVWVACERTAGAEKRGVGRI